MVYHTDQRFFFIALRTRDRANGGQRWFLNKDNVEIEIDLENCIYNKIVFLNIL